MKLQTLLFFWIVTALPSLAYESTISGGGYTVGRPLDRQQIWWPIAAEITYPDTLRQMILDQNPNFRDLRDLSLDGAYPAFANHGETVAPIIFSADIDGGEYTLSCFFVIDTDRPEMILRGPTDATFEVSVNGCSGPNLMFTKTDRSIAKLIFTNSNPEEREYREMIRGQRIRMMSPERQRIFDSELERVLMQYEESDLNFYGILRPPEYPRHLFLKVRSGNPTLVGYDILIDELALGKGIESQNPNFRYVVARLETVMPFPVISLEPQVKTVVSAVIDGEYFRGIDCRTSLTDIQLKANKLNIHVHKCQHQSFRKGSYVLADLEEDSGAASIVHLPIEDGINVLPRESLPESWSWPL